jgi:hypothetical protein
MTLLGDALKAALAAREAKARKKEGAQAAHREVRTEPAQPRPAPTKTPKIRPAGARPVVAARWVGAFARNPIFDPVPPAARRRIQPSNNGIARQLTSVPTNEADLVLGLDFGTSMVKAVIRDVTARQAYLVPFTVARDEHYLLPTRIFRSSAACSLDEGELEISNLKLQLIACDARLPVAEFNDACVFLALVIRHCRGWFLGQYSSLYRGHKLNWTINVGMPTRSYEDQRVVGTFHRLAWAAANLASDGGKEVIRSDDVALYRQLALLAYEKGVDATVLGGFEFQPSDVAVVPEIAAQVHGFVESGRWDSNARPYMALMDVGAGTVDTAFFCVMKGEAGRTRYVFYSTDVQPLGVLNLHWERIRWIRAALHGGDATTRDVDAYLDGLEANAYSFRRIPESVREYVPGLEYATLSGKPSVDADFFRRKVVPQLAGCIAQGKADHRFRGETLRSMPFFLSGGGSRMGFYRRTPAVLNDHWHGGLSLDPAELPLPRQLEAPGLAPADFDRVSVAFGLSSPTLGEIVRPQDIPPLPPALNTDYRIRFVDKDMA